jgi:hypothetical protein
VTTDNWKPVERKRQPPRKPKPPVIVHCPHCGTDFTPSKLLAVIEQLRATVNLQSAMIERLTRNRL